MTLFTDLRITETDGAGNLTATYVQSSAGNGQDTRVDIILPENPKNSWQRLLDVFLPAGYPHSVTEDYFEYQIYDSLQAFASSIAGLLASRAVLEGVGVGDATASPTAALLMSILQDSMGRIATILFAHRFSTALEPECKMYRLLADIFNDIAMVLDCLSPAFPKPMRVMILSGSSVLRALCGVAAGSSKASLSAHFARMGNIGELNAKDSSQETVISLLGMLAGTLVVSWVKTPFATWSTLIALLAIHLAMNHAAVRAVSMRSLNRQRANILLSHMIAHDEILTPQQVSAKERIFELDGVMRDVHGEILGFSKIGVTTSEMLEHVGMSRSSAGSIRVPEDQFTRLMMLFKDEDYVLHFDRGPKTAYILLKRGCNAGSQIKAWYHVLLVMHMTLGNPTHESSKITPGRSWASIDVKLRDAGWDLSTASLETHSGTRISLDHGGSRAIN